MGKRNRKQLRRRLRLRNRLVSAALLLCASCSGTSPDELFHRFVEDVVPGNRWHETKAYIAYETRNVLSAPYRSEPQMLEVGQDGTIPLGSLADLEKVSPEAAGIKIWVSEGFLALNKVPQTVYIPLPADRDVRALAGQRVQLGPAREDARKVRAWAREVIPLPQEYVTKEVRIPQSARLDFGIGLEDEPPGAPASGVRFTVSAELNGVRRTLFAQMLNPLSTDFEPGWVDASLDLSELAGSRVRFVFRTESGHGQKGGENEPEWQSLNSPVWSSPILCPAKAREEDKRPNLVLVCLDTLRADHLGCYGYHRKTSPNIDKFAAGAYLFENAIASSSWTLPSHASMFTGLTPSVHGATVFPWGPSIREQERTLAEVARERGYLTAAYTEGGYVRAAHGFAQGFELYSDGKKPFAVGAAEETFEYALDWLRRHGSLPFLLFVHTYQTHAPYTPPKRFATMFDPDYTGRVGKDYRTSKPTLPGLSDADKAHFEALYDGEIAYTDEIVGSFLNRLREMELLDDTAVIIFSDHGEEFWEHGGTSHGETLYDEQLRVPLIIRFPGDHPPIRRVTREVSMTDLYATVAEIIGDNDAGPPGCESLLPLLSASDTQGRYEKKTIVSELSPCETRKKNPFEQPKTVKWWMRSVRTDDEKYITYEKGQTEELYNLRTDPGEENDVAPQNEKRLDHYRELLDSFLKAAATQRELSQPGEPKVPHLTEDDKRRMKALGYI